MLALPAPPGPTGGAKDRGRGSERTSTRDGRRGGSDGRAAGRRHDGGRDSKRSAGDVGFGRGKGATGTHTKSGAKICKPSQDSRGCQKPCPNGNIHCCDYILKATNQVCGSLNHTRNEHNPSKDGIVKQRG